MMSKERRWLKNTNCTQLLLILGVLIAAHLCFSIEWTLFLRKILTTNNIIGSKESVYLTAEEMIKREGYANETHVVQTEDGYLLQIHRISKGCDAPIVLFLHGFYLSSTMWIIHGRNKSLAYMLADEGYDVWLGNFRGNMYSRAHVNLDPSQDEFWNFSWHEMGIYDIPAMLSYVTRFCKKKVEALIHYSMGGTSFFVMVSERPEALRMIQSVYCITPLVYTQHSRGLVISLATFVKTILTRSEEMWTRSNLLIQYLHSFCTTNWIDHEACIRLVISLCGPAAENFNTKILKDLILEFPLGGSNGQALHYSQMFVSKEFRKYDFGMEQNIQIYGSVLPPEYHFSNYTTPTVILAGGNDYIVSPKDLDKLARALNNTTMCILKDYNHIDFIFGKRSFNKYFKNILLLIKKNGLGKEQDIDKYCQD